MKKKISFIIILLILISTFIFPNIVSASEITVVEEKVKVAEDLGLGDLDNYKGNGEDAPYFISKVNGIVDVIENIGIVVSVIALVIIGIK